MKVAITGTIGSGKSTVLNILKGMGYPCLSADAINAQLLQKEEIQQEIVKILEIPYFRKEFVRDVIFSDDVKKNQLESYLHPLILAEIQNCNLYKDDLQFIEVPLLFESHWDMYFDYSVIVYCDDDVAMDRLIRLRKMSEEDARQRIQSQIPVEVKLKMADYQILNNDSVYILRNLVNKLLNVLREKKQ